MSFLNHILKAVEDENTFLASEDDSEVTYTDTGCYNFNALLSGSIYGGLVNNKITVIAGEPSTGKTYLAFGVLKKFLDADPNAGAIYYDTEFAITPDMLRSRGVDADRVIISQPETVEAFRTHALNVIEAYNESDEKPPFLMILDSLGQLSTNKEMKDSKEGNDTRDMTKAQVIKGTFRTITLKLGKAGIPFLVTNHVYDSMDQYKPKQMSGGSGAQYSTSTTIFLSKSKDKDGDKNQIGVIIKARVMKGRFVKEGSECEMKLSFKNGLDKYYGLLDLVEKYGIFKKVATKFELPTGEKVYGKDIYANPEKYFTKDILDQIDEAAKKEYMYGE